MIAPIFHSLIIIIIFPPGLYNEIPTHWYMNSDISHTPPRRRKTLNGAEGGGYADDSVVSGKDGLVLTSTL
jgi:hypothetical protein